MAKKKVRRTPQEQEHDAQNCLRSKAGIEPNHWVSGAVHGCCPTCVLVDEVSDGWEMHPLEVALLFDVNVEAVETGLAKARMATRVALAVVEQHPEIAEREHEDLDSLGETGVFSGRLPTEES